MAIVTKGGPKDVIRVTGSPKKRPLVDGKQDKMRQSHRNQTYMLISPVDILFCNPVTNSS